jgi:cobalt-zinc-cadmium resistance protein CzcA
MAPGFFQWLLKSRAIILMIVFILASAGIFSVFRVSVDAFPDVSPVSVTVLTEAPGLSPLEVEQQITYSIETVMNGLPSIKLVRSKTLFGLSSVTVVFDDSMGIYRARTMVSERLSTVRSILPPGVEPVMGAVSTPTGNIFRYTLSGSSDLMALRTLQDWVVKRALLTTKGVASVLSYGGFVKSYYVIVDPYRLDGFHLSLRDVTNALAKNNSNVGGGYLDQGGEYYLIRGIGRIYGRKDIESIVVAERGGVSVLVRDVADVKVLPEVRRGNALLDGQDVVKGTVIMLRGENALKTLNLLEKKVSEINKSLLPPGIRIAPYYDEGPLIRHAFGTVLHSLVEGGVLVIVILGFFLGRLWASFVVATGLPLSILLTFLVMGGIHLSADLMSLGGIVIGIGMMVDASIVMAENIERLSYLHPGMEKTDRLVLASSEIVKPVFFAIMIIVVVFFPILFLPGMPGKMFAPMGISIIIALLLSLIVSMTFVPVMMSFEPQSHHSSWGEKLTGILERVYMPLLDWTLKHSKKVLGGGVLAVALVAFFLARIGTEFIPVLDEGSFLIIADLWPSASLNETTEAARAIDRILRGYPEVLLTQSRIGRAQSGTDTDVTSHMEIFVTLRPHSQWPRGMTKKKLSQIMSRRLNQDLPSVSFAFSQPIEERIDEMVSGAKAQVALKVFADRLDLLTQYSTRLAELIKHIRGTRDVTVQQITGQPYVDIRIDRRSISQYGLNVSDVLRVIRMGIGPEGLTTTVLKGVRRIHLHVRFPEEIRSSVNRMRTILLTTPKGISVPLGQLASFTESTGPFRIYHEGGGRLIMVQFNISGRATSHVVSDVQKAIARKLPLPTGIHLSIGGEFENTNITMGRLKLLVPLVLTVISLLLFWNFRSFLYTALILLNIPFSLVGGVLALKGFGEYLSIPASVGFIALFGVAIQNGVLLLSFAKEQEEQGHSPLEAIRNAAGRRIRPVLMTALVGTMGIVPLLLSTGTGANVQRPLAAVVVGGLISSTAMTLLVLPAVYVLVMSRWRPVAIGGGPGTVF